MLTRREMMFSVAAAALSVRVFAAEDTFKGEMVCAKCFLNKPDAKECQDVLLVTDSKGTITEYYITKNTVSQESGEACTQKIPAVVVGTVSDKDGRRWPTASKITKS
jgi:hypothetical protein